MRKIIMVTNYYPEKVKEMREKVGIESLEASELIGIEELELLSYENKDNKIAIDIFLLGTILKLYEEKYFEDTTEKLKVSITTNLMYPHPDGLSYQENIVSNPNYKGLSFERNAKGNISWMTTKDTLQGIKRLEFWEIKRKECDITANNILDKGIRQKVAFCVHPTKLHTCLFSGEITSLEYRYLAPAKIVLLNTKYDENFYYYDIDIYEIIDILFPIDKCHKLLNILNLNTDLIKSLDTNEKIQHYIKNNFVKQEKSPYVSPGVMSNSPDRLDGYHSYNSDIRDVVDTGRRKSNLKRYTQDRRAYENWADGDWNKANRLMGEYHKHEQKYECPECKNMRKMSPDHIGPISLGFAHRAKFQPLCSKCNSSKNNKMSFADVKILIEDEKGESIISWHSQYIWNQLKGKIINDADAYNLSVLMRVNMHNILELLAILYKAGYSEFLKLFLNPDYAYYNHTFTSFEPKLDSIVENVSDSRTENDKKKANRYLRVSFESLESYSNVTNRKVNSIINLDDIEEKISEIIESIEESDLDKATSILNDTIILIGNKIIESSIFRS